MAQYSRLTVYEKLLEIGALPLFYHSQFAVIEQVALACTEAGSHFLEFTNRGDNALQMFVELKEYVAARGLPLILGAGTIVDEPTAALYIAHGANFIVAPNSNPAVARLCNRRKIAYIPGCATVTEISDAEEMGAEIIKVFPGGTVGGPEFIRSLLGPLPWSRLLPSGGVEPNQASVREYIQAGSAAIAVGKNFITLELLAARDYAEIGRRVAGVLQWIKEARG